MVVCRKGNLSQLYRTFLIPLSFGVFLLMLWSLLSNTILWGLFPGPEAVLSTTIEIITGGMFLEQIAVTIKRVLMGFLLALRVHYEYEPRAMGHQYL